MASKNRTDNHSNPIQRRLKDNPMPQHLVEAPRIIMVPVSRPDTAKRMLQLAVTMVKADEGKVIALVVALDDTEKASQLTETLEPTIQTFADKGHHVEIETVLATSISRGILDAARERGADLLILGVQKPDRRQVQLGSVVENVMQAAPCNVLVYRTSEITNYRRIAVPINGTVYGNIALRTAVMLAKNQGFKLKALYVQRDYVFSPDNEIQMRDILSLMLDETNIDKIIIAGDDPATRILNELDEHDLLVVGFSQNVDFDHEPSNQLADRLLNRAPGPMVLTSRLVYQPSLQGMIIQRLRRMNPVLTIAEQNEMLWQGRRQSAPNLDYVMMIVLSAGLASLGLMLNSVAVIIGAMLVAPLMQPLAAFATGLVSSQLRLTRRAGYTLTLGVVLALLISIAAGVALPLDSPTTEMASRGNPSLLDAAVALVSGLVAAYATARKGVSAALAGVAIAAALMPPLCTVGLGIALQSPELAVGAALLFLTNITFIIAAEAGIFLWLGLRPREHLGRESRTWITATWVSIGAMLVVVVVILFNLGRVALNERAVAQELTAVFAPAEFVEFDLRPGNPPTALLTLRSSEPITTDQVRAAQQQLESILGEAAQLQVAYMQLIRTENIPLAAAEFLQETFPDAEFVSLKTEGRDPLLVDATLRSATTINEAAVIAAQERLTEELGLSIRLQLTVEQIVRIEVTDEVQATPGG